MTYNLFYDTHLIATVSITPSPRSETAIKEMVEFGGLWRHSLAKAGGDYTQCWLRQLTGFILREGGVYMSGGEGWYPLDGSYDIKMLGMYPFDWLNEDLITTKVVK
jgi:hypothetical protein